jgi:hypothetical protein
MQHVTHSPLLSSTPPGAVIGSSSISPARKGLLSARTFARGLILFWAIYLSLITVTNSTDLLKTLGLLPQDWVFASGNYQFIVETTSRYHLAGQWTELLFVGVIVWELLTSLLLWFAYARYGDRPFVAEAPLVRALVVCAGLWAAFVFADELSIAYAIEATHLRLLIAVLVSALTLQILPNGATGSGGPGMGG